MWATCCPHCGLILVFGWYFNWHSYTRNFQVFFYFPERGLGFIERVIKSGADLVAGAQAGNDLLIQTGRVPFRFDMNKEFFGFLMRVECA